MGSRPWGCLIGPTLPTCMRITYDYAQPDVANEVIAAELMGPELSELFANVNFKFV